MVLLERIIAILLLPASILIILEKLDFFTITLNIDKVMIGAVLMILLQAIALISLKMLGGEIRVMRIATFAVFVLPAIYYLLTKFFGLPLFDWLTIVVGIMMLVESLYGLH